MPDDWPPEALRAQAVVARSYALATLKPGTLFDLYADTRSQVYGGVEAEEDSTNRAIGSTAGKAVFWKGRVATTFYHSTSGGRTVSIEEAWPNAAPVPYLVSVADPHDRHSKHHHWGPFLLTPAQVAARIGVPGLRDLVVTRGPSGRVTSVRLKAVRGTRTMLSQAAAAGARASCLSGASQSTVDQAVRDAAPGLSSSIRVDWTVLPNCAGTCGWPRTAGDVVKVVVKYDFVPGFYTTFRKTMQNDSRAVCNNP